MPQGDNQVGPVDAVDIIRHAFALAGRHAAVVFGTALIVQTAVLALSFVAMNALGLAGMIVWMLLLMAASQLSIGIYTLFLLHLRHGHPMPSAIYLLKEAAPLLLPLLWLGLLSSLGILVAFMFFFIPGVILSLRWAVAAPALVAKRVPAVEALSISRQVTSGSYGTVFTLAVIQMFIASVVPRLLGATNPTMAMENLLLMQAVVAVICTPIVAIASAELFLRLARVPNRIDADAPLGGAPAPTPNGPWVPLGAPAPSAAPAAPAGPYVPMGAQAPAPAYGGQPAHAYAQPAPTYGAQPAHAYGATPATPAHAYGAPATHVQPYGTPVHAAPAAGPAHAVPAHMYAANAQPQPTPAPAYAPPPVAAAQPYAPPQPPAAAPAQPQPFAPPTQAHVVPTAQGYGAVSPQPPAAPVPPGPPAFAPAAPTHPPMPGIAGPPAVAERAQSVGPPGMR